MKSSNIIFLLLFFAGLSVAATPISQCTNITVPGEYYLTTNLVGANQSCLPAYPAYWESCIRISSSDVTFDCNGSSMSRGGSTKEIGILAQGSSGEMLDNITVKNCDNMVGYTFYTVAYQNVTNGSIYNVTAINAHSSTGFRGFGIGYGNNISIYDNTVKSTSSAAAQGALISDSSNIRYTDNYFNFSTVGDFYRCNNSNISNNLRENPTSNTVKAVFMEDTNYTTIQNNSAIGRCGSYCFELDNGCNYNVIDNNTVRYGFGGYGILITDPGTPSTYNNVTNNVVEHSISQYGIGISGSYSYVANNRVNNMSGSGVGFYIADTQNDFHNNTATNCAYSGFWLTGATNTELWDTKAINNTQHGIRVASSSSSNYFYDTETYDNGQSGARIEGSSSTYFTNATSYNNSEHGYHSTSSTNTRFNNASAFENNWSGFYVSSGSSRIEYSSSHDNNQLGVYFSAVSSGYLRHSSYYDNGQAGMHIYSSTSAQIINNTIYDNNGDGIFLERANSNSVRENEIHGNNGSAVNATGLSSSNLLSSVYMYDNNYYSNALNGVRFRYVRYGNIQRNNITSNSSPLVMLNRSYGNTLQDNILESSSVGAGLFDVPVYSSTRNTFTNNTFRNLDHAAVLWNSSRTTFTGSIRNNIAISDYILNSSNDVIIQNENFNESNRSVVADSTLGSMLINLTMANFSQAGTNHSIFSMGDTLSSGESYFVNWSGQPSGAPHISLHGKFVTIESLGGSPSIDTAMWYWDESEISGYDESLFDIFKYNSTWTDMNASLDTGANTLTLSSASPLSSFGILQGGGIVNNLPDVQLNLPANGSALSSSTVIFNFTATDLEQTTLDCSIYLDSLLNQTNASTQNGTLTSFTISNIANGPHTWYVNCSDGNLTDASDIWEFTMNAPVNCPVITTPGTHIQPFDYIGAPNDATEVLPSAFACVKIASSDVVFDCNGYSITNDGTADPTMGVVLNGSIDNVTLQNCPSISGYSFGFYNMDSDDSTVSSVTVSNSSNSDFVINQSSNFNMLSSHAAGGGIAASLPTTYSVASASYGYSAISGTSLSLPDDGYSSALPIGFNFTFFGAEYDQFYIGTNGFITFTSGQSSGCCSGQSVPSASSPNNLAAAFWEDLNPTQGGVISYETIGTAPNRILVVEFDGVPHYYNSDPVYFQIKLFETSGNIEVHCQDCTTDGGLHTQGIEDQTGSAGYAPAGRNRASFSAVSDAVRFTPAAPLPVYTYGIIVEQSSDTSLDANTVNGSDVGILLTESTGSQLSSNEVFGNGDGISLFDSDTSSLSSDHLYDNQRDLYAESAFTHPFDLTLTEVIFDNPAAGFTDFTNLSVEETLELDSAFYMKWNALPAALPADHTSFENKHLNITRYFGSPVIDQLVWHWLDSESAAYTETNFVLYKYDGAWELVNDTPDTTGNTLSNFTLSDFSVFSILQDDSTQQPPDDGDVIGTTDSNGEVELESDCDSTLIIRASKSGYISKTLTADTVSCSDCEQEPEEEPEPEPKPQPEPECAAPACCTTDSQCSDIDYCSNRDTGAESGSCIPVTGCGAISNHIVSEPYECSNQSGCSCPEGFVCRDHICVLRDLNGTKEAFVGFHGNFHATEGSKPCSFCEIVVTDPAGKVVTGKTDANGDFTLPLTLEGTYKLALLDESGEVAAEASLLSLLKPDAPDEPKPTAEDSEDFSWLFLLILLIAVLLLIVYKRRKDAKKS